MLSADLPEFSELIGSIYDAAVDLSLFPQVMKRLQDYLEAAIIVLFVEDALYNMGSFVQHTSFDDAWAQKYFETYMPLNPVRAPSLPFVKAGDTFHTLTYLTDEEFRSSRYYREWFAPKGYLDTVSTILERSSLNFAILSAVLVEDKGYATEEDLRRMNLIAPHMRRAVAISQMINAHSLELAQFVEVVDGLRAAVIFCDPAAHILHANAAAATMLRDGTVISSSHRRLMVKESEAEARLRAALNATGSSLQEVDLNSAAVILSEAPNRYIAHVLPLKSSKRAEMATPAGATAAIFIRQMGVDTTAAASSLVQLYGLTKRELTIILSVSAGHTVHETAAILGISEDTVRVHLKSIFQKVGVRKQSELTSLVAHIANPFVMP